MSFAMSISFEERGDLQPLQNAIAEVGDPVRLANRIGPPLAYHWSDHLKDFPRLPGDFQGMPKTGYGEAAAESVQDIPVGEGLILRAQQQGILQRLKGGTIRARNKRALCFGVKPESYGRSYGEVARALGVTKRVKGEKTDEAMREKRRRLRELFGFAKQVTQRPNPNVIPPDMPDRAVAELRQATDAILHRRNS